MPEICTDVLLSSFSHIIDEEETETSYYYWQVKEIAFVIRFSLARFNTFLFLLYIFFSTKISSAMTLLMFVLCYVVFIRVVMLRMGGLLLLHIPHMHLSSLSLCKSFTFLCNIYCGVF